MATRTRSAFEGPSLADRQVPPDHEQRRASCVLVVDDDPHVLVTLTDALSDHHHVVSAASIAQAMAILDAQTVDVVVLDYCLPDGPGTDVIRLIKHGWPSLPVIVITGYGSETLCSRLFRLGVS